MVVDEYGVEGEVVPEDIVKGGREEAGLELGNDAGAGHEEGEVDTTAVDSGGRPGEVWAFEWECRECI